MSRIKGKDTGPELHVRSELHRLGLRYRKHVKSLPGTPDIVFTKAKIAIFIDGDFWHGRQLPLWEHKLSDFWKKKIAKTRDRDTQCRKILRAMGWQVIRLWQRDLERNPQLAIRRITSKLQPTSAEPLVKSGKHKEGKRKATCPP
jgi:DNA mismatch endonuclease (patch repair protein)